VNRVIFSAALCSLLFLGGCSTQREYYGLASDKGSMVVTSRDAARPSSTTLDARTPVVMHDGDKTGAADIDATQLRGKFARALEAQPLPPKRFTLYFVEGGDTLTAESQTTVTAIFEEIRQRPAPDLIVVGHTDRVGSVEANDQLAIKRATTMREQLIKLGIDPENIHASGRGERDPLVPTADEVAEPRNRRVEILVR
jgi:outer membrane protein OmpA-like peptidoglycan-associated protein